MTIILAHAGATKDAMWKRTGEPTVIDIYDSDRHPFLLRNSMKLNIVRLQRIHLMTVVLSVYISTYICELVDWILVHMFLYN